MHWSNLHAVSGLLLTLLNRPGIDQEWLIHIKYGVFVNVIIKLSVFHADSVYSSATVLSLKLIYIKINKKELKTGTFTDFISKKKAPESLLGK